MPRLVQRRPSAANLKQPSRTIPAQNGRHRPTQPPARKACKPPLTPQIDPAIIVPGRLKTSPSLSSGAMKGSRGYGLHSLCNSFDSWALSDEALEQTMHSLGVNGFYFVTRRFTPRRPNGPGQQVGGRGMRSAKCGVRHEAFLVSKLPHIELRHRLPRPGWEVTIHQSRRHSKGWARKGKGEPTRS